MKHTIRAILSAFTVLMLVFCLAACGSTDASDVSTPPDEEAAAVSEERMTYPGFTNRVLDWDNRTLTLPNDEKNPANLIFVITDSNGEERFSSDPVAPGESVKWDAVGSGLGSGKQKVTISMTAVTEEGIELNKVSQTITLKIPGSDD